MPEVEVKKPRNGVPPGFKICPKCKNLVKGPRTKVCTHDGCGHQFQPKKATKPARASKAAKPVKEVVQPTVVEEPQVPVIPDPYTTSQIVMLDQKRTVPYYKNGKVVKKVSMITRSNVIGPKDYKQNQVDLAMRKALENYDNGGSGVFEPEVDYAWPAELSRVTS